MPAIGMGMIWGGYTLILWGYCKLQGYDIGIAELAIPGRFTGKWPPPPIDDKNSGLGTEVGKIVPGLIPPPPSSSKGKGSSGSSSSKGSSTSGGVFNA